MALLEESERIIPLKLDVSLPESVLMRRGGISFGSYEGPATQPRFDVSRFSEHDLLVGEKWDERNNLQSKRKTLCACHKVDLDSVLCRLV